MLPRQLAEIKCFSYFISVNLYFKQWNVLVYCNNPDLLTMTALFLLINTKTAKKKYFRNKIK